MCVLVDFAQGGREVGHSSFYCEEFPSASEIVSSEDIDGVSTAHVFKKRASTVLVWVCLLNEAFRVTRSFTMTAKKWIHDKSEFVVSKWKRDVLAFLSSDFAKHTVLKTKTSGLKEMQL